MKSLIMVLKKPLRMADLVATIEKAKINDKQKYILVADDDAALCDNLYEALSECGHNVAVACDGQVAVAETEAKPLMSCCWI